MQVQKREVVPESPGTQNEEKPEGKGGVGGDI